jgi:polysaccharide biosynthesis transport protein
MFAAPTQPLSNEEVRRLDAMRIEFEAQLVSEQELLKELKSRSREDLKNALPTAVPDPQLSSLLEQLNAAEQRLIVQRKDYGPENLGLLNTQELVDDINRKVNERISGILVGLEVRVAMMKARVDNLAEQVEKAKTVDIEFSKKSRPYFDAKERVENLKRFQLALTTKIAAERIDVELPKTTMVEIVDTAKPGIRPVRPNKMLNIILGVVIGLVVGVGLAFFIEYLDTSVKTIDDVERTLQSPVLGVIPQNVGLLIDEGAESPHAEAYRVLRTNLLFSRKDDKLNSVAVVSAGAGEGKSTTVFNMASVFAQSGQRVLIVDSDLRRPTLHKMLRVSNSLGLTNYLLKQNTLEEVVQTTKLPMLDFMASGKLPSSSLGILSSAQMKNLINELKQRYDFVFFDSPPIMGVSDASILASEVDMTLQVIQYRRYPQPMNIRAKQMIEKVGGNLVGIVLNNINMSQDESYYYYSGYYHDYYSKNEDEPESAARGEGATVAKAKLDIKQKY